MNSSRIHLERRLSEFASGFSGGDLVLDAGAGDCRYRVHFEHCDYESQDFAQVEGKTYGTLDYVSDIRSMPIEGGRFDGILCTQVLAHISDPAEAIQELCRVMKPGGRLMLTAPLFFQENEPPHDHFRFTQWGLRGLFERAGLEVEQIDWLEGYAGTVSYQLGMAYRRLPTNPKSYGGGSVGLLAAMAVIAAKPMLGVLAALLAKADTNYRFTRTGMCKNYVVIARRPGETDHD